MNHRHCWTTLSFLLLQGACSSEPKPHHDPDTNPDTDPPIETFELIGSWDYTGGFSGLTNQLTFSEERLDDVGDYNGTEWAIVFSIESWDNEADQAQLKVTEITGFSHYPIGEVLHAAWQMDDPNVKLYFDTSDFPTPTGGTEGGAFYTYTRVAR